jgi:hypothetical protein
MGDFRRLCSASLWKSGPLFSTGTEEAELVSQRASVEPAVVGGATLRGVARALRQEM